VRLLVYVLRLRSPYSPNESAECFIVEQLLRSPAGILCSQLVIRYRMKLRALLTSGQVRPKPPLCVHIVEDGESRLSFQ
jgi:hypothetical protein